MKILIVKTVSHEEDLSKNTYNKQGVGLATELSKLGHECGLVFFAKKGKGFNETIISHEQKINVYHIEGKSFFSNAIYNDDLYKICDEYDIIQPAECDQITSWLIYKKYPKKTIIYHGPYNSKYTKKYNLRSKVFDLVFSNLSNFKNVPVITKSYFAEDYLRAKGFKNITTLGVGLNEHNFQQNIDDMPDEIKLLQNNKKELKYILYIGTISKRKNLKFILKILNDIVNKKNKLDYKLIIVGSKSSKEADYFTQCFDYIKKNRLENNIIYINKIEQKYLKFLYEVSDIFVLPTQYDIFGMVYLEAMYFGVPIITTLCGGSSLLINNDKDGYIISLENKKEWCDTIVNVVENPKLKNEIAANTKKIIRDKYLWSKLALEFEKKYKELL